MIKYALLYSIHPRDCNCCSNVVIETKEDDGIVAGTTLMNRYIARRQHCERSWNNLIVMLFHQVISTRKDMFGHDFTLEEFMKICTVSKKT